MLSPLDDRYADKVRDLTNCFSGFSYTKERVKVEIKYLVNLCSLFNCSIHVSDDIFEITEKDYNRINEIEKSTNHDVKAIEYFLREHLRKHIPTFCKDNLIHFGLTSQDVNSIAFSVNFKKGSLIIFESLTQLWVKTTALNSLCKDIVMLSRTHGQPATPIKINAWLVFYIQRFLKIRDKLKSSVSKLTAKCGGAVGNLAAHKCVRPDIDWDKFMDQFVESFDLVRNEHTTQIDSYDSITEVLSDMLRMLIIVKDYTENIWNYIKDGYLKQMPCYNHTGSSTMPHKVNPINFENALGNISLATGMLEAYIRDLPLSRYQRDLKDSTMLRSIGEVFGKINLVLVNVTEGTYKIQPNKKLIEEELNDHAEIIMEPIQTYLRYIGILDAYELAKDFSRGRGKLDLETIQNEFINKLEIDRYHKEKLLSITPSNYVQ